MTTKRLSWLLGVCVFVLAFLSQLLFYGIDWIHAFATYGCIPLGFGAGFGIYNHIEKYIETQFKEKWDLLYYERNNSSSSKEAAKSEIQRITDEPNFYLLPKEQQIKIMSDINNKYGL